MMKGWELTEICGHFVFVTLRLEIGLEIYDLIQKFKQNNIGSNVEDNVLGPEIYWYFSIQQIWTKSWEDIKIWTKERRTLRRLSSLTNDINYNTLHLIITNP